MRSVQPPSNLRPTPVPPRPAYLVRLTLDGLDAWTSNTVLPGSGGPLGPCLGVALIAGAQPFAVPVAQLSGLFARRAEAVR